MFRTTLKNLARPEAAAAHHRHRRRPRRRVHGRHARAHRHDRPHVRHPLRRRERRRRCLRPLRRVDRRARDSSAGHHRRLASSRTVARRRRRRRRGADDPGLRPMLGPDGEAIGTSTMGPPTYGGNWIATTHSTPSTSPRGGRPGAPARSSSIVAPRSSAISRSATAPPCSPRQGRPRSPSSASPRSATPTIRPALSYALFDLATAQTLVGEPGRIDGIRVAAAPGVGEEDLAPRIAASLDGDLEVLTGERPHRGGPRRRRRRPQLLQHVPGDLCAGGAVRRLVPHLQHVHDPRRPAQPRNRTARGRSAPADARCWVRCSARRSPPASSPRRWVSSPASASPGC